MPQKSLKPVKPVVGWVIYRESKLAVFEILTTWRVIQNPTYDPLGITNQVWESGAETLDPGEDDINGLLRGILEELGTSIDKQWITPNVHWRIGKNKEVCSINPLCMVENLAEPHHWKGAFYAVQVPPTWEPVPEKSDGEAGEIRWWEAHDLFIALRENPEQFMLLSIPAFFSLLNRLGIN